MGSNSLLEGMVLGEIAGRVAAESVGGRSRRPDRLIRKTTDHPPRGIELGISDLVYSLKSLMWRQMGLERDETALLEARDHISFWFDAARQLAPAEPRAWELINMLTVASIATEAAIERKESRGVHFRTDYVDLAEPKHSIMKPILSDECTIEGSLQRVPLKKSTQSLP